MQDIFTQSSDNTHSSNEFVIILLPFKASDTQVRKVQSLVTFKIEKEYKFCFGTKLY